MVKAKMQKSARLFVVLAGCSLTGTAWGQATTRQCSGNEDVGPACLLARQQLPSLPAGRIFWHLDKFATREAAEKAAVATSTVADAFGSTWLFTVERKGWRPKGGEHVSDIGPLPVQPAANYAAEYLRSVFTPGMTAPLHVHSGPEAFYAVTGDTCLETPDGIKVGRGAGNSLFIKGGPPMLLMAIGKSPRQGFALILHDASRPPTTLIHDWQPKGLCKRQLSGHRDR
ncbi:hypothetical protein M9979_08280 [Sphingomonas sp. RP10(2022)]|uniref:Cupin domain-containing protein n=1 Tax=Sphingomonas liriopis TaxID=2949094 RepID=A0A9X2HPE7_9SPHN|nr:hypothetical protein [Sphingomonas liriopis]MCP3734866.1 hypothetical protein [Sphingomonas liriopis]